MDPRMDDRTRKIITLINVNLRQELSLVAMAQAVNLSPSRLRHSFKAETGTTPTRYLHKLRMQQAKELLETTFLTVKEIMVLVGLHDKSHFVRNFKRAWGSTPK
jgi:AraC-like DNA-binding protein